MASLYSIAEIIECTGARAENVAASEINSISIDSREIENGALYVAIKGDVFDGHDFVKSATENGAVAALVSEAKAIELAGLPLIIVPDALAGMVDIAKFARSRSKAKIIAVTGSAGKTSTKEILKELLQKFGKTHASIKSFNNHWGVPLMLARMAKDTQFGVFEIGMNHSGEISLLSQLVKPDIAVITSIAPAHLEQLGSIENIAKAKAEIFDGLEKSGIAIINVDHQQGDILFSSAKNAGIKQIITYGFAKNAKVGIVDVKSENGGMSAKICWSNMEVDLKVAIAGRHRLANASVALIIADILDLDIKTALDVLAKHKETTGRGQVLKFGASSKPLTLIDESFNANPLSMKMALDVFKDVKASRYKILVLADMFELGKKSQQLHIELKNDILAQNADKIFLIGNYMQALVDEFGENEKIIYADNLSEIKDGIIDSLDYGDVIMLKGSKGMKLSELVKAISQKFN